VTSEFKKYYFPKINKMQFFSLSGVFRNFVVSYLDNIFLPTVESTLEGEDRGKGNREKGGGRKEKGVGERRERVGERRKGVGERRERRSKEKMRKQKNRFFFFKK